MKELLKQTIKGSNEQTVVEYFLSITKNVIKCTEINEKKMVFYIYDHQYQFYKKIETLILEKIFREELILNLTKELKKFPRNKVTLFKKLSKLIFKIGTHIFCMNCIKVLASKVYDKEFSWNLDKCRDTINFRNGNICLKTGKFRKRTNKDYVSKILDYDYQEKHDNEKMKEIAQIYLNIFNDDPECLESAFNFLGYSLTGQTGAQKMLFIVGPSASNGKSTNFKIFEKCFPIYCKKIDSATFNENNQKRHKTFAEIENIKLLYVEEPKKGNQDVDIIKDIVDGNKIGGNEVMYGTIKDIVLMCKIAFCSNNYPTFPPDFGIERRVFLFLLKNKFIEKHNYDSLNDKKGYYIKDNYYYKKLFYTSRQYL